LMGSAMLPIPMEQDPSAPKFYGTLTYADTVCHRVIRVGVLTDVGERRVSRRPATLCNSWGGAPAPPDFLRPQQ